LREITWIISSVLRPPKELYKKYSEKLSFCYAPGHSQFQDGYIGINESSVSGILELNFPSDDPVHDKQIDITLKGVEYVFWTENHGKNSKTYRHKEILICQDICVWRSHDNTYQQINELQLPFQFELPDNLPSSVKFAREESKIYYSLKASMKQESSMLKFRGSTKFIKIRCPITRYSLFPTISIPTQFSNYDDPSAISRGIGYSVSLEHNCIPPRNDTILNSVRHSIDRHHINVSHKFRFKIKFGVFGGSDIILEKDIKIEDMITQDLM
ncbi:10863_t:CDS:2, partial [Diversispora eburnea]